MNAPTYLLTGVLVTLVGAMGMLAWRIRETKRALSAPSILLPPLGMSTGFAMFALPAMRVPWSWAAAAFLLGALVLWYPLQRTSTLRREGDRIMLQRSRAFLAILLGLLALRFALRSYIGHLISPEQTAAVLFILAFGMVLRWRAEMYLAFRRLQHAG